MTVIRTMLIVTALLSCLSACNTTDALTPQVDIPNGATTQTQSQSQPVTQADADQMARAPQATAGDTQTYTPPRREFGPQSTLQAQADALERGNQQPAQTQSQPQVEQTQQTLRQPAAEPEQPAAAASTSTAASGAGTVRFLPIIGAPVQAVTPLSRQLGTTARARGLTIKSSADTSSDHILKGYFSAFADGGTVTVVYVWDVLDNAGARLHRIQGQESVAGDGADPWAAVPATLMQSIASKTIDLYLGWRQDNRG